MDLSAPISATTLQLSYPDWILVHGASEQGILESITSCLQCRKVVPTSHFVLVYRIGPDACGIQFNPMITPFWFLKFTGWLGDSRMTPGAMRSVGWLTSPKTRRRYCFSEQIAIRPGDILPGVCDNGDPVEVYAPSGSLRRGTIRVPRIPEPLVNHGEVRAVTGFEITIDSDPSFGNPEFIEDFPFNV